ncbi:MAG: folate-binding protein [Alphaproteobacteria bacterium HGW-Alphaproteobacteria-11]|nr:MAG: folate-binding protein [Alphaproteobacteria bacterium HGW-Alphaproteobacteria-11]
MNGVKARALSGRGVLRVGGPEARSFLQGLITNDVEAASGDRAVYAALLTPQGKFLFDFFVFADPADKQALLLDCDGARIADLVKRLTMYKLRAKVTIEDLSATHGVAAYWNEDGTAVTAEGARLADPRLAAMGARAILHITALAALGDDMAGWQRHRIGLGVGDAAEDFEPDRTFPLEVNLDLLNGIDFHKGCYVGQEVTSRTKRRGSVRKRLVPCDVEGDLPAPGTPVKAAMREVGTVFSGDAETVRVMALLRLDLIKDATLEAGPSGLAPDIPAWLAPEIQPEDGDDDA